MGKKKKTSIFQTLQKTSTNASSVNSEVIREISVANLRENPLNRFSMSEDEAYFSTLESVKQDGFLEDIIVTKNDEFTYRIISGHRRVNIAKALGKNTVPCKIRTYASQLDEIRALIGANIYKRDISPLDMCKQITALMDVLQKEDKLPQGQKESAQYLAEFLGISRASVERYLDLQNLSPKITEWLENGSMTLTDAYELGRKKNSALQPIVEEIVDALKLPPMPSDIHRAIVEAKKRCSNQTGKASKKASTYCKNIQKTILKLDDIDVLSEDKDDVIKNLEECKTQIEFLLEKINR